MLCPKICITSNYTNVKSTKSNNTFSVDPVTEQSKRMLAELALPGRQGSGIETKMGWKNI